MPSSNVQINGRRRGSKAAGKATSSTARVPQVSAFTTKVGSDVSQGLSTVSRARGLLHTWCSAEPSSHDTDPSFVTADQAKPSPISHQPAA